MDPTELARMLELMAAELRAIPAGLPSTFRPELVAVGQPVILGNGIIARAIPTAVGALDPA